MSTATPITYRVETYNVSHASENKIHDDAVARQLGFASGLVPGVEVYAYACHPVAQRWGRTWLERGSIELRFLKPVYDGRIAAVSARETAAALELEVHSEGLLCAAGRAWLTEGPLSPPSPDSFPFRAPPRMRPPATPSTLSPGTALCLPPQRLTPAMAASYLRDVRETDPLYAREGLVHPGVILRLCNLALKENVALPPWIHVGSRVTNFAAARVGDELSVRARVEANYPKKGHRLVDLDALVIANGGTVVARVLHTAVYQLRQLAARA
ncbi:MAG TPA: hotdog fold domain-containing protein [Hyphomicrobiaceae bacterium]|jgi:acyl dehydratase